MYKKKPIERRKIKIRNKIILQNKLSLTVYKSNKHTYAQVYNESRNEVITSMSTIDKIFKNEIKEKILTKSEKSKTIGTLLAKILLEKNIKELIFDRSGFKFHGRIKEIANILKNNGIKC